MAKNLRATPCNTVPELWLQTAQVAWKASEILCPRQTAWVADPTDTAHPPAT